VRCCIAACLRRQFTHLPVSCFFSRHAALPVATATENLEIGKNSENSRTVGGEVVGLCLWQKIGIFVKITAAVNFRLIFLNRAFTDILNSVINVICAFAAFSDLALINSFNNNNDNNKWTVCAESAVKY